MRLLFSLLVACLLFSCSGNKAPDVSDVQINLTTHRFEKDLFTLDTNNLGPQLDELIARYPTFGEDFLSKILQADPMMSMDSTIFFVKSYLNSYRYVFDSSQKVFLRFDPYENEIKKGLQFVHYYFPRYRIPNKIITYIGPLEGIASGISEDAILIGLQAYLGKNFSLYSQQWVQDTYPSYISDRFQPPYIAVNSLMNIILDMYPESNDDRTLVVQMVDKGKRLYLLSRLLPEKPEYMLIGYTQKQLKESYSHEAQIWNMFIQNNFLQTIDNNVIKNYVGEGPKTQELGEGSPGNIGSFSGWQIVKRYMDKHPDTSLPDLMNMSSEKIFNEAKYKP